MAANNLSADDECIICLDPLRISIAQGGLVQTPCQHIFHFKCLVDWMISGDPGGCCPLCNRVMKVWDATPVRMEDFVDLPAQNSSTTRNSNRDIPSGDFVFDEPSLEDFPRSPSPIPRVWRSVSANTTSPTTHPPQPALRLAPPASIFTQPYLQRSDEMHQPRHWERRLHQDGQELQQTMGQIYLGTRQSTQDNPSIVAPTNNIISDNIGQVNGSFRTALNSNSMNVNNNPRNNGQGYNNGGNYDHRNNGPINYDPNNYAPTNFVLSDYIPSNYGSISYGPGPSNYFPNNYGPINYSPINYAPSIYGPNIYGPINYGPSNHVPSNYVPNNYVPSNYVPIGYQYTAAAYPFNNIGIINNPVNYGQTHFVPTNIPPSYQTTIAHAPNCLCIDRD